MHRACFRRLLLACLWTALAAPAGGGFSQELDPALQEARTLLQRGETKEGLAQLDLYLESRLASYGRLGAEDAAYVKRWVVNAVATETAYAGLLDPTLGYLGQIADTPATRRYDTGPVVALSHAASELRRLPAHDRYERLSKWTLPERKRKTIRMIAAFAPAPGAPEVFFRGDETFPKGAFENRPSLASPGSPPFDLVCNLPLLVEAAREAGRLMELEAAAHLATEEKIPRSELLLALVAVARGDRAGGEPLARSIMQAARDRQEGGAPEGVILMGEEGNGVQWADFLLARAMLRSPKFADLGRTFAEQLVGHARSHLNPLFLIHLGREQALAGLSLAPEKEREHTSQTGLELWLPACPPLASWNQYPGAWWTAHEGCVRHHTGHELDRLYFRYPLTGEFEFSVDATTDHHVCGDLGYGGLIIESLPWEPQAQIRSVAWHEMISRPRGPVAHPGGRTRLAVQVAAGVVTYRINGRVVYEDRSPSGTSPWLHLACQDGRHTVFSRPRMTGQYEIPRAVPLSQADRLEGWISSFFGETQPPRISLTEPAAGVRFRRGRGGQPFVWRSEEGVIFGAADADAAAAGQPQSVLFYARPLESGDAVRYEFFHEPKVAETHPAVGRLAFLLRDDGIRLHWLARPGENFETFDLDVRNEAIEPEHRRGPERLPLKVGDWNEMNVAIEGDSMSLELNGVEIYERPLEPTNERRFGLFHYKDESEARVRNVVMTGDWPESLSEDELANPFISNLPPLSAAALRARHAMVGERALVQDAMEVALRAKQLPDGERYAALRKWVLPSDEHPTSRLQAAFTPLDTPPAAIAEAPWASVEPGALAAPALDLVEAAAASGELESLAKALDELQPATPNDERALEALRVLVALARKDEGHAEEGMKRLCELTRLLPKDSLQDERLPAAIAVWAAIQSPKLLPEAKELYTLLATAPRTPANPGDERIISNLCAAARWASDPEAGGRAWDEKLELTQWTSASYATSQIRGLGGPSGSWRIKRGEAAHFPGGALDALYWNTPLAGDFEIEYERSLSLTGRIQIGYGGLSFDLFGAGTMLFRGPIHGDDGSGFELGKRLEVGGGWARWRLAVTGRQIKLSVDGEEVHTETYPEELGPWLFFQAPALSTGAIRNVRILGSPTIPEEIELSAEGGLASWRSDYYSDSGEGAWSQQGNEFVGEMLENARGTDRESLIQYHRPLLEDGELRYEFYYDPDTTEVHPALDRLAFLLRPEGVRLHWLTDAEFDRTGVAPGNEFRPAEWTGRPLPLKAGEWNKLALSIAGGQLTIRLNGEPVVEYSLPKENRRTFGLFRYKDAAASRVRGIVYRGAWPKSIPKVEDQELALP